VRASCGILIWQRSRRAMGACGRGEAQGIASLYNNPLLRARTHSRGLARSHGSSTNPFTRLCSHDPNTFLRGLTASQCQCSGTKFHHEFWRGHTPSGPHQGPSQWFWTAVWAEQTVTIKDRLQPQQCEDLQRGFRLSLDSNLTITLLKPTHSFPLIASKR
jgi:hypothetical protein